MIIAHHAVSALQRKQLENLAADKPQKMAQGGEPKVGDEIDYTKGDDSDADIPYGTASVPPPPQIQQAPVMQEATAPVLAQDVASAPIVSALPQQPAKGEGFDLGKSYQLGQKAISEQQAVDVAKAEAAADIQSRDLAEREAFNQSQNTSMQRLMEQRDHFIKDYSSDHVNANHYVENMSAGEKVATSIGLLLGGFSAGFGGGENPALEYINKQIERDIASQQARKEQQKTILGANEQFFKDSILAQNQTRINMNDIYDRKIQLAASKLGTPQAKANADAAHAKFALENAELLQKNASRAAMLQFANQGGPGLKSMDPAQLLGMVPEKDRAAVSKEIADAKEFIQGRKHLLDTFDKVAKLNTVANLANPTVQRASQVEALTNTASIILGKLVGTGALSDDERAAMLKAFASIADRKEAVASKRANIISIMDQKRPATPLFKATTGMDLDRFQSTSVPVEAQYKTVNGVRYMRGPNGEAIPVK